MNATDLLIWARGTGFNLAIAIFILGMLLRVFEVISLGRKADLAEGRGSAFKGGLRTLWTRNFPRKSLFAKAPLRIVNGYVMHIGLFVVIFMYGPHIALIESAVGFGWPSLPSGVIDAFTAITLLSLAAALVIRLLHPVMRFLSDTGDYVAWLVTLLPVLTGYLTYNHLFFPYTLMLALHILSVELFLVVAPFSKLTHMFSFAAARWYQGAEAGYRGTESMSKPCAEKGVQFIKEQIDSAAASLFSACVHCGLCAEACLFYTETGDPKYTPIHKLELMRRVWEQEYTLWGKCKSLLGFSKPVNEEDFAEWEPLVYDACTMCRRCSLVCPVGNDISGTIRKLREGFAAAGYAPDGLVGATTRAIEIGSPMGVRSIALQAQIRHVEKDTGLEIPLDREGAEYMVILSSMEVINFPEYLEAIARIFKQAGKTWTIASDAFEATNSGIQIGVSDLARELVQRVVDAAERLKVKTVVSPECGHAYTAIRWEGPNLIGRPFAFKVRHILEVLDEFRGAGLFKTEGMEEARLTFHDPCQLVRKSGVVDQPRNLLKMISGNFVEMQDHSAMNWCCGGGGGVSAIERAEELRLTAFKRKKSQLDELGVQTVVTACANCRISFEEGLERYNMDMPVLGLTEMLAEHLVEETPQSGQSS